MSHPARKPHQANAIGHFDIAGPELAPLRAFYVAVFGWDVAERGPGYALVATPDGGPNGAIVEEAAASLTLGIVVPDLDGAIGLVGAQGGRVLMPPLDNGWVRKAQVADPAGNRLTLIEG